MVIASVAAPRGHVVRNGQIFSRGYAVMPRASTFRPSFGLNVSDAAHLGGIQVSRRARFATARVSKQQPKAAEETSEGEDSESTEEWKNAFKLAKDAIMNTRNEINRKNLVQFLMKLELEMDGLNERVQAAEASSEEDIEAAIEQAKEEAKEEAEKAIEEEKEAAKAQKDSYIRLSADFENFRRRTKDDAERTRAKEKGKVLEFLLPILDDFQNADKQINAETDAEKKMKSSYNSIYSSLISSFDALGLKAVEAEGKEFNPEVHEAVLREPSEEVPDGVVIEEFRKGFSVDGHLLRASMVKVSSGNPDAAQEPVSEEAEADGEEVDEVDANIGANE